MSLEAEAILDGGDPDEAARLCNLRLNEEPDDVHALYVLARCFAAAARYGAAAALYHRILALQPNTSGAWNNLGHAMHTVHRFAQARECFTRAAELDPANFHAWHNLSTLEASLCRAAAAIDYAHKAIACATEEGHLRMVRETISMPLLGTGNWREGWQAYRAGIGGQWRRDRQYASEGLWDGTPGQTVVVYGEQGIGDEVMFGSILPDIMRDCEVIIECDRRLETTFRRTFPGVTVYGTRHDKVIDWPRRHRIDARIGMGQLGEFYRNEQSDFPRRAYLMAERMRFERDRPLVGIAWTGGTQATRTKERSFTVTDVEWLARARPDVQFVSLEYKGDDCPQSVLNPTGLTRDTDYGKTISLVADLDCVVSVTTAVALAAGAVGTRCLVAVPPMPTWHWGYSGEMPWFDIELVRTRESVREALPAIAEAI